MVRNVPTLVERGVTRLIDALEPINPAFGERMVGVVGMGSVGMGSGRLGSVGIG